MIEAIPYDTALTVAAFVGAAALGALAGREWGRRALHVAHKTRDVVDTVCDAIADGELTRDEIEQIVIAGNSWLVALKEPRR